MGCGAGLDAAGHPLAPSRRLQPRVPGGSTGVACVGAVVATAVAHEGALGRGFAGASKSCLGLGATASAPVPGVGVAVGALPDAEGAEAPPTGCPAVPLTGGLLRRRMLGRRIRLRRRRCGRRPRPRWRHLCRWGLPRGPWPIWRRHRRRCRGRCRWRSTSRGCRRRGSQPGLGTIPLRHPEQHQALVARLRAVEQVVGRSVDGLRAIQQHLPLGF